MRVTNGDYRTARGNFTKHRSKHRNNAGRARRSAAVVQSEGTLALLCRQSQVSDGSHKTNEGFHLMEAGNHEKQQAILECDFF